MATEAEAKIGHTPGPWGHDGPTHNIIVWSGPENRICFMTSDGPTEANARLIAAAPDLLATLIGAIATWEKFYPLLPVRMDIEDAEFGEFNKARAAVCKAIGLQPWEYHQHFSRAEGRS